MIAVTVSSKSHPIILLGQLLQGGVEHGKNSGFYDHGPPTHIACYEMSSLVGSNIMWNTMTVGKAYQGFSVGLCCQIWHLAATITKSALVSGSTQINQISITMASFFIGPLGSNRNDQMIGDTERTWLENW